MDTNALLIHFLMKKNVLKTPRIIEAFRAVDRKMFVPLQQVEEAYKDHPLPIGEGQTISQPTTVAIMLELLNPQENDRILDIGAGSGWTTALLSSITGLHGNVVAIERIPSLCEFGHQNLKHWNKEAKIHWICGDGTDSLKAEGPFHRILASAAASNKIPNEWREELLPGGAIVAPVGHSIWRFSKGNESEWKEEEFQGFSFVPLITHV